MNTKNKAQEYIEQGFSVVPMDKGTKAPKVRGWESREFTAQDFQAGDNIGIKTTNGLVDVDLDVPEALVIAHRFLPPTHMVSGHAGNPRSHHFYKSQELQYKQYLDVVYRRGEKPSVMVELRTDRHQTVVYPSVHPEGHQYTWCGDLQPAQVSAGKLKRSVELLAATTLLARHWPKGEGSGRHDFALGIAGFLAKGGLEEETISEIVEQAALLSGDDEIEDRLKAVEDTVRNIGSRSLKGASTVVEFLGEEIGKQVLQKLTDWLHLRKQGKEAKGETVATRELQKHNFRLASDFKTEKVTWLWNGRIANGKLSLIQGDPGLAKSQSTYALIAAVTSGKLLPESGKAPQGGVVLIAPEDGIGDTINPRLLAAGADLSKVVVLGMLEETNESTGEVYERPISFPEDRDILAEAVDFIDAKLVVIDPVMSVLGAKIDAYKDPDVRKALSPVVSIAEKKGCAVVGVMHLTKGTTKALYKGSGSIAFVAMARSVLFAVKDPDDTEDGGVLVNIKNNLAPKADSLRYTMTSTEEGAAYIKWNGVSQHSEDDLTHEALVIAQPLSESTQRVMELIKSRERAWSVQEVSENIGMSYDAAEKLLNRRFASGALFKPARGMYTYHINPLYTPPNTIDNNKDDKRVSEVSERSDESKASDGSEYQNTKYTEPLPSKPTFRHSDTSDMGVLSVGNKIIRADVIPPLDVYDPFNPDYPGEDAILNDPNVSDEAKLPLLHLSPGTNHAAKIAYIHVRNEYPKGREETNVEYNQRIRPYWEAHLTQQASYYQSN